MQNEDKKYGHVADATLAGGGASSLSHYSSLNSDDEDTNATSLQESFQPSVMQGWSFRRDRPGKPFGWIAESRPQDGYIASAEENMFSFVMTTVSGTITVTYLSTYENSGVFEVYMGVRRNGYESNGGIQSPYGVAPGTLCKGYDCHFDPLRCCLYLCRLLQRNACSSAPE